MTKRMLTGLTILLGSPLVVTLWAVHDSNPQGN
jgi:hypothetical protein